MHLITPLYLPLMRGGWRSAAGGCASTLRPLLSIPVSIYLAVTCHHYSYNACTECIKMDVQHYLKIREPELPFITEDSKQ